MQQLTALRKLITTGSRNVGLEVETKSVLGAVYSGPEYVRKMPSGMPSGPARPPVGSTPTRHAGEN